MSKTKFQQLSDLGQSLWLDYINRSIIESGQLKEWINLGLRGMTSNPTIFQQAIGSSSDYDEKIARLKEAGKATFEIYDELTVKDIQDACDLFLPVYKATRFLDGYVSLEINPLLANDTSASIQEGKRLFKKVNRPNVMIKVPATDAGFPVIEALLSDAINVNVTLIFSLKQYQKTVQAFLNGLTELSKKSKDLSQVRSVASVFVSRIDNVIDPRLEERISKITDAKMKASLQSSLGKAAVANCRLIYEEFTNLFSGPVYKALSAKNAHAQRVLWGSTSTKNAKYSDIKYVTELIADSTVNTVPEKTMKAFLDHGVLEFGLKGSAQDARELFAFLKSEGIDIDQVCTQLLNDGVSAFEKSFESLLKDLGTKAQKLYSHP